MTVNTKNLHIVSDLPKVPTGWTRATSNANYAFQISYTRVGGYFQNTLVVQNLVTGATENLISVINPAFGVLTDVYDVSADGTTVIYGAGIAAPDHAYQYTYSVFVQHLGKPQEKLQIPGTLLSVQADATNKDLVVLEVKKDTYTSIMTVNTKNLHIVSDLPKVPTGWTRATSNVNYAFQIQTSGKSQVLVAKNLLTGAEIKGVTTLPLSKIGSKYDIAPDGKTVVYSISGPGTALGTTVVQSLADPSKKVTLAGTVTAIKFVNGYWILTVNGRSVKVNPITLKIVR
jgi:hypothetical protein